MLCSAQFGSKISVLLYFLSYAQLYLSRYSVADEADITAFISVCGYDDADLISDTDITVPKHWNTAYTAYNDLQLAQGFDLTPYKGKSARELVFSLSDSPEHLYLLLCDDKIIAAHICSHDGSAVRPLISD